METILRALRGGNRCTLENGYDLVLLAQDKKNNRVLVHVIQIEDTIWLDIDTPCHCPDMPCNTKTLIRLRENVQAYEQIQEYYRSNPQAHVEALLEDLTDE